MLFVRLIALLAIAIALVSCSANPQKILERGNKYYDLGKYKEASIMYRQAIRADPKFGEAYYHLGLAGVKGRQLLDAVNALRRAMQLLPANSPDQIDASFQYAEIMLTGVPSMNRGEQGRTLDEVRAIKERLLKHNPDLFAAQRLLADLTLTEAVLLSDNGKEQEARDEVAAAVEIYRKALTLKPGDYDAMVALGRALMILGQTDEAEKVFRQVIDKDKTLLPPYQQLYKLYVLNQRLKDAEDVLRRAIATHPDDYDLKLDLAALFVAEKNRPEMAKVLDNLKTHFKEYPDAYKKAGEFYLRSGDADQALREYQAGAARDHAHRFEYQKLMVDALIHKGDFAQAYEKNKEILKANAKDPEARALDANFLLKKGETDAAVTELEWVITARPENYQAHYELGRAYFDKKEMGLAAQQFEAALKVRPDYLPARQSLAQLNLLRGDASDALTVAQGSLKMNPNDGVSILLVATAYVNKGEPEKARPLLEPLVKANPKQADPLAELAVLNLLEKRYKEADDLFRRAYQADPSNLRGLLGAAEIHVRENDSAGAVQMIAEESKKQPERADLKRELANFELQAKQYDKAIADYRSVVNRFKEKPLEQAEIYGRIGHSYEAKGDAQHGLENYRKANQLAPSSGFYSRRVADLLEQAGKSQEAMVAYRNAMKIDPSNPILMLNLAQVLAENGQNLDEALTLAQRAKQQLPNLDDASDTIGWIYIRKNLSDNAVEIFKTLTAKVRDNPTYHYHYGLALVQKGETANALKEFRTALQNNPKKPEEAQIKQMVQKLS